MPPTARIRYPNFVLRITKSSKMMIAMKMKNSQLSPSGLSRVKAEVPRLLIDMGSPSLMVTARPWQMNIVEIVVIHDVSPTLQVNSPLISPINAPAPMPTTRLRMSPRPQLAAATPIIIPAKHPFMPTDRSISPDMMTSPSPNAHAPINIEPVNMEEMYLHVRKFGASIVVTTHSITIGINTPISGVRNIRYPHPSFFSGEADGF